MTETSSDSANNQQFWHKNAWKYGLILALPLIIYIYPKPFIKLLNPLIRRFKTPYRKINHLDFMPQIILLTNNPDFNEHVLQKQNFDCKGQPTFKIYDLLDLPQNQQPTRNNTVNLWTELMLSRINLDGRCINILIIKADTQILQGIEINLFNMKKQEAYKISSFGKTLHILRRNDKIGSYQPSYLNCQ